MIGIWFLVLVSFKNGAVVIPQPYMSKEACLKAATEMVEDGIHPPVYNSDSFSYVCVKAERT